MIKPFQRKLIEAAVAKLDLGPMQLAQAVRRYGDADVTEALTQPGYERLMNYFTVIGFVDRRRPIVTLHTSRLAHDAMNRHLTAGEITTRMHSWGFSDFRDIDGQDFLRFMAGLEYFGFSLAAFLAERREVTPSQVRLLQLARKRSKVPDDRWLILLQTLGAVNSAADLDRRGFDLCMMWMEMEGFDRRRLSPADAALGKREGFASGQQLQLIRKLWSEWSGGENEAALNAWLERYHRVSTLRFLTTQTASKAIAALRAMKRRPAPAPAPAEKAAC